MKVTVIGSRGFIGSHLARRLRRAGHLVQLSSNAPDDLPPELGHVFYCAGLTADFRGRPFNTVSAHVEALARVLRDHDLESLLYLSSTHVYAGASGATEETQLSLSPDRPEEIYKLSKLLGESLCLNSGRTTRVVRLSNVYGNNPDAPDFLPSLLRDAARGERIVLRSHPDSAKDYVSVDDVVELLPRIALEGKERIYNVASGRSLKHSEILDAIARLSGVPWHAEGNGPPSVFPDISIARVRAEFGFTPSFLLDSLESLLRSHRAHAA